ncbi:MAG TPA: hypothetical protein VNA04_01285, partial [Thermoanaerobaculia bacterium]|nr:hypothetical protein [Thermoanaerobaculia bacterium]
NYLRDYIWSIGITSMREPRPEPDAPLMTIPGQLPRTPPPTPLQTGEARSVIPSAAEREESPSDGARLALRQGIPRRPAPLRGSGGSE